ncbi:hypothetical protein T492DRAFT_367438 [Pavlovales sp. CCMP2436]|nr:hypothetical protein T492DRAFT_367438 [Pavlovales sp. CCMP2436]
MQTAFCFLFWGSWGVGAGRRSATQLPTEPNPRVRVRPCHKLGGRCGLRRPTHRLVFFFFFFHLAFSVPAEAPAQGVYKRLLIALAGIRSPKAPFTGAAPRTGARTPPPVCVVFCVCVCVLVLVCVCKYLD